MKWCALFLFVFYFLLACTADLYEFTNRTIELPDVTAPKVHCFKGVCEIEIFWEKDKGADEYYLYRDETPEGFFNELCYQGQGLSFVDSGLENEARYYYKLAKRKETMLFEKSACVMGAANIICQDNYENNNIIDFAISDSASQIKKLEFVDRIDANIYYYFDASGNELEDVDWYWVHIPKRRYITFTIDFPTGSSLESFDLYYGEYGKELQDVIGGENILIENELYEDQIKFFCIRVNKFLFEPGLEGGKIGTYRIQYKQSNNIL
jgi:hypothetical protein